MPSGAKPFVGGAPHGMPFPFVSQRDAQRGGCAGRGGGAPGVRHRLGVERRRELRQQRCRVPRERVVRVRHRLGHAGRAAGEKYGGDGGAVASELAVDDGGRLCGGQREKGQPLRERRRAHILDEHQLQVGDRAANVGRRLTEWLRRQQQLGAEVSDARLERRAGRAPVELCKAGARVA
eukprot:3514447-Prymnesium_polylepis.1